MTTMQRDPDHRKTEMTPAKRAAWLERQRALAAALEAQRRATEADQWARQIDLELPTVAAAGPQPCLHILAGAAAESQDGARWLCSACTPPRPARRGRR